MNEVELWTDGACSGNPGPGGWAALLRMGTHERVLSGGEVLTTNNRMELTGVVRGLRGLTRPCRVRIHTDSTYVKNAFTNGWLTRWQRNGWTTRGKQPVKNRELWLELLEEAARHQVEWVKVAGHAGIELNERADRLACAERDRYAELAGTTRDDAAADHPAADDPAVDDLAVDDPAVDDPAVDDPAAPVGSTIS